MIRHTLTRIAMTSLVLAGLSSVAAAQDFTAKDITVSHPYARETPPGARTGAAYLTLVNKAQAPDQLLKVTSAIAAKAELHTMTMDKDVMRMREVGNIPLKPGEKVNMRPGSGYHVMLIDLKQPLKAGEQFPLTLEFAKAGKLEVMVVVEKRDGGDHKHHHH